MMRRSSSGATRALPDLQGHRAATRLLAFWTLGVLALSAGAWTTFAVWYTHGSALAAPSWYLCGGVAALGAFCLLVARGHFRTVMMLDVLSRIADIASSVAISCSLLVLVIAVLQIGQPTYSVLAGLLVTQTMAGVAAHVLAMRALRRAWLRGRLRENALVYSDERMAAELAVEIGLRPEFGIDVVGFIVDESRRSALGPELPGPAFDSGGDLRELIAERRVHRLIIGPGTSASDEAAIRIARQFSANGVAVFAVPRFFEMGLGTDALWPDRARGYPLIRLQRSAHPYLSVRLKRAFDVLVAASLLVGLAPLIVGLALLVRLTSPGPVLFQQDRIGQHGRLIVVRKFRSMSMSKNSDSEWTADERITSLGKWLRRLNLDELPQLWSVVRGDMSLVGPRPERPLFVERFSASIPEYADRHRMQVGITGLAQIAGLRGDTSIPERVKYDNLYIDQWSFRSDLQILAKTVAAIFSQRSDARRLVELEQALEPIIELAESSGGHPVAGADPRAVEPPTPSMVSSRLGSRARSAG